MSNAPSILENQIFWQDLKEMDLVSQNAMRDQEVVLHHKQYPGNDYGGNETTDGIVLKADVDLVLSGKARLPSIASGENIKPTLEKQIKEIIIEHGQEVIPQMDRYIEENLGTDFEIENLTVEVLSDTTENEEDNTHRLDIKINFLANKFRSESQMREEWASKWI